MIVTLPLIFLTRPSMSLAIMLLNMAVSKVVIYKIHAKDLHIFGILKNVFIKYLQAR